MDWEPLPANYLKAGEEYLVALKKLGLTPEFLGWGQLRDTRQWQLVMVTSLVELSGPLTLNELLFKAYNMHATPKEISPFIVRIYGSKTILAPMLKEFGTLDATLYEAVPRDKDGRPTEAPIPLASIGRTFGDFHIDLRDIYRLQAPMKLGLEQRERQWNRFKESVERLAA